MDSSLFEPGEWQNELEKKMPTEIPPSTRQHLTTPCGLLFNELITSPESVMRCIEAMLDIAMDLDSGSSSGPAVPIILYVIRLTVRIEGYASFVIEHSKWQQEKGFVKGCGWGAPVRGLLARGSVVESLRTYRLRLCEKLRGRCYSMLEHWRYKSVRQDDISEACVVHAHMGYIFYNIVQSSSAAEDLRDNKEMTWKAVETLLSCQIYLTHNYGFTVEAPTETARKEDKKKKKDDAKVHS